MSDTIIKATGFPPSETMGSITINRPEPTETGRSQSAITDSIGGKRGIVRALENELNDKHRESIEKEWASKTSETGKKSVKTLLDELADLGFAWRDIARMTHVSVPAIRKWRHGGRASGDNRRNLAALLAMCDMISSHFMVEEVASWFEMPLDSAVPITPIDLYEANRPDLVFECASGHSDPTQLMDEFDPEWRERYRSDFKIEMASDGDFSIVRKDR